MRARRQTSVRGWLWGTTVVLAWLMPGAALAQEHDPAAAQALFDQAGQLMQQGQYAEACPKLLESNRLDPGIGTQFHLADCYEKSGKIATAWATFLDVASVARSSSQPDREKAALKRASQLESRLPKLVVNVPESSRLSGLEIRRDDILVGSVQWGVPMPVDPGAHQLSASAPGYVTFKRAFKLDEQTPTSIEVPALVKESAVVAPAPPAEEEAAAEPEPVAPPPPPEPAAPHRKAKNGKIDAWPLVLGGAGVAALGVGTAFALMAKGSNDQSKGDCGKPGVNDCGPTGLSRRNDALDQGNVATWSYIAGGALLGSAVVVWIVEAGAKKPAEATIRLRAHAGVAPGAAALYLQGSF